MTGDNTIWVGCKDHMLLVSCLVERDDGNVRDVQVCECTSDSDAAVGADMTGLLGAELEYEEEDVECSQ